MSNILVNIFHLVTYVIVVKAFLIGSDFSFYYWFKYGKKYTMWYENRKRFKGD